MSLHVPSITRVPFAPLDNPRLRHLASAKNRQNGRLVGQKCLVDHKPSTPPRVISLGKRSFEPSAIGEPDGENVDPSLSESPTKKSKSAVFAKPARPPPFVLKTPKKAMPSASAAILPSASATLAKMTALSPRTPPAGRSPVKRKSAGFAKTRPMSTFISRIDPPLSSHHNTVPFSLDAAVSGTFSAKSISSGIGTTTATITTTITTSKPMTPCSWSFDIYEDSPEEEAANLMEHSTLTLDLCSDDERDEKNEGEKENMPPEGYDVPAAAMKQGKKGDLVRRKIIVDQMDDGKRSPLSDLEADPFIPDGLTKDSHVVVDELVDSVPFLPKPKVKGCPAANDQARSKDEIVIWEDSAEGDLAA